MTYKYKKKRALILRGWNNLTENSQCIKLFIMHTLIRKFLEVNIYSFGYINKLDNVSR